MQDDSVINERKQKRSEPRTTIDEFYRIEISKIGLDYAYQFKIWNMSKYGMCILVKKDSELLNHLEVGDILDMKYFKDKPANQEKLLKTVIKHITKDDQGLFKEHYLVGLSIIQSSN
ncbi:MAG: hypothetical protein JRD93_03815 [Deltaproteobacteria bacterium]|nr:hypothetical protein [Deltaproteobacteria bacterium]MBW2661121.1 hypothetical protein [Deltaproteobacteria bacterium]